MKPRICIQASSLFTPRLWCCTGWLDNRIQHLTAHGRTHLEAWEMWKQAKAIYEQGAR